MTILLQKPNSAYLTTSQLNRQAAMKMEKDFEKAAGELSSGGISTDYSEVSDVELFVDSEVQLEAVQKYSNGNNYNIQRMRSMASKLDQLQKIANNLQQEISLARSTSGVPTDNLNRIAKGLQLQVSKILNSTFSNEYLFSGTATLTPAVGSIDDSGVTPGGTVTTTYYQGNQEKIIFNSDQVTQISVGVNASNIGIAELIYGINLCVYATSGDLERLGCANDLCNAASQDIISANTGLKIQMKNLDQAQEGLSLEKENLQSSIKKVGYKTPADAMQRYMDTLTSKDIALALLAKNDSIRRLVETLR